MKKIFRLLSFCFLLMFAGCATSLNPLYTEQDLIFEPFLLGVWTEKDSPETWEITSANGKNYKIVYTDETGRKGEFVAHLLQIENRMFLDLTPAAAKLAQNDFYREHFLPAHSFALLTRTESTVQMSFLEQRWLKKFLAENPSAVRHAETGAGVVLTASPKELQKFLLLNLNTEGAFIKPLEMRRKNKGR